MNEWASEWMNATTAAKKQISRPQPRAGSQTDPGWNPCSATCLVNCVTLPEIHSFLRTWVFPSVKWAWWYLPSRWAREWSKAQHRQSSALPCEPRAGTKGFCSCYCCGWGCCFHLSPRLAVTGQEVRAQRSHMRGLEAPFGSQMCLVWPSVQFFFFLIELVANISRLRDFT